MLDQWAQRGQAGFQGGSFVAIFQVDYEGKTTPMCGVFDCTN